MAEKGGTGAKQAAPGGAQLVEGGSALPGSQAVVAWWPSRPLAQRHQKQKYVDDLSRETSTHFKPRNNPANYPCPFRSPFHPSETGAADRAVLFPVFAVDSALDVARMLLMTWVGGDGYSGACAPLERAPGMLFPVQRMPFPVQKCNSAALPTHCGTSSRPGTDLTPGKMDLTPGKTFQTPGPALWDVSSPDQARIKPGLAPVLPGRHPPPDR